MKRAWERGLAWIDQLSLRERVMMFGAIVVVLAAATHLLFVSAVTEQQKKLTTQIDNQSASSEARMDRLQAAQAGRDRGRITTLDKSDKQVQAEIDQVNRDIAALSAPTGDASGLSAILARVLKRNDRVKLVRVLSGGGEAVIPAQPLTASLIALAGGAPLPGASLTAATAAGATTESAGLQRDALDITLAGNYLDLMEYLVGLEKAIPGLRWGSLKFSTDTVPAQLTVRILLISAGSPS